LEQVLDKIKRKKELANAPLASWLIDSGDLRRVEVVLNAKPTGA